MLGGGVDRPTLVELIEVEKAKLFAEPLRLWEELDASLYNSAEDEPAFIKRREAEIIERMDRLPEADRHTLEVLSELRAGLYESDSSERRGDPSRWHREECVIRAALVKERDDRGRGSPLPPGEDLGRTVDQALARLKE